MLVSRQGSESAYGAADCIDLVIVDAGSAPDFVGDAVGADLCRAVHVADGTSGRVSLTIASAFIRLEVP